MIINIVLYMTLVACNYVFETPAGGFIKFDTSIMTPNIASYQSFQRNFAASPYFLHVYYILLFACLEYMYRIYLFIPLLIEGKFSKAFQCLHEFNRGSIAVVLLTAATCFFSFPIDTTTLCKILKDLISLSAPYFLLRTVNITECWANTRRNVFSSGLGLDPGSAMACSYFYGYLKIILPSGGSGSKGIASLIENFEAEHKCEIPVKKLFILLPSSSYIPHSLTEISNGWLTPVRVQQFETVYRDRAGVKKRPYTNTVYAVYPKGPKSEEIEKKFVVTEGATPLVTFMESQRANHNYAKNYESFNYDIVCNFYETLKMLLDKNPDCGKFCELVYYEDKVNNENVNPAPILLERINKYENLNNSQEEPAVTRFPWKFIAIITVTSSLLILSIRSPLLNQSLYQSLLRTTNNVANCHSGHAI